MTRTRLFVPAVVAGVLAVGILALALLDPPRPAPLRPGGPDGPRPASPSGRGVPAPGSLPAGIEAGPPAGPVGALEVRGALLDEEGGPVEGAPVHLVPVADEAGGARRAWAAFLALSAGDGAVPDGWSRAVSGKDGRFDFEVSKPGRHLLLAGPPDRMESWLELSLAPGSSPVEPTLVLRAGLPVAGRVVEDETGAGVPGVAVSAFQRPRPGEAGGRARETVSGPDGGFSLAGFEPGPVELRASAAGAVHVRPLSPGPRR
ncbi:MAG: carboxypeptidase-like regulatory domain-containing protein, partial [Planctomycetes bacterium]|nr:carboxypeptidase-like regulatory domain-containing protein [Planctomycetota bacterium]